LQQKKKKTRYGLSSMSINQSEEEVYQYFKKNWRRRR